MKEEVLTLDLVRAVTLLRSGVTLSEVCNRTRLHSERIERVRTELSSVPDEMLDVLKEIFEDSEALRRTIAVMSFAERARYND